MAIRFTACLLLFAAPLVAQDSLANRTLGSAKAPVTVYEMSDFQCPYCREFAINTFPTIKKDFIDTGKVRWIFVNFPLAQMHPNAVAAAEFAMCAARQHRFWPAHDMLYQTQPQWEGLRDPTPYLVAKIPSLKLDRKETMACLQSGSTRSAIRADAEGSAKSGAHSTPSFYIEGGMMSGALPASVFKHVLDSILVAKRSN